ANFAQVKYVIDAAIAIEKQIINYAAENEVDYICIATQGAGVLRKIMGTNTSYIVNNAKVPVLVIPSQYQSESLKTATYLSDFENVQNEIATIAPFTNTVNCGIEVLHYSSIILDKNKFESSQQLFSTKEYENIKLNIIETNLDLSLVDRIAEYFADAQPELLIMFTKKEKSF